MSYNCFLKALENRRSYYKLAPESNVTDDEIVSALHDVIRHMPSAYHSQSTRLVLLLGNEHKALWTIVKEILSKEVPPAVFVRTESKIDSSFASGHGTVLFFEDQLVVESMVSKFPLYGRNFPLWSQHTSAMHQFAIWTLLEEMGFGASLQHYNPLIDKEVKSRWHLPEEWKLIAQLPFGLPLDTPEPKKYVDASRRVIVLK